MVSILRRRHLAHKNNYWRKTTVQRIGEIQMKSFVPGNCMLLLAIFEILVHSKIPTFIILDLQVD